ncbi:MAG: DMT family transporter [Pyramidobacter sp.]|jgi:drug/metabolite transporter (DMT)-like permease
MNKTFKGIALSGMTGILWGLTTPATKLLGQAGVSISLVVLVRMVMVALILLGWLGLCHPEQLKISRGDLKRIFWFSLFGPTGLYLGFMLSVEYLEAATALVLHYTYPIVTVLCSSMVTGERPMKWDYVGACLVAMGVACSVMTPQWTLNTHIDVRGVLWGAAAVIGIVGQTLLVRASNTKGSTVTGWGFFFYTHLCGIFWTTLYIFVAGEWTELSGVTAYAWMLIFVPSFFGCLVGYSLYFKSLECVPASVSSLMASVEILSAVGLTALATHAVPSLPELVGCAFIFAAIALVSLKRLGTTRRKLKVAAS